MTISRRQMIVMMGATAAAGMVGDAFASPTATAPSSRIPLDEFVKSDRLVALLRKGVREMSRRKPSDPLSWVFQAAIHGITPKRIKSEAANDPGVTDELVKRYWNQYLHHGENSANFLPWHRGYTYHFERILRMHTEDDSFSLPYWNYEDERNRKFPREFGIQFLDGNPYNTAKENQNPLYLAQRNFYLTKYEHPFVSNFQPLIQLSPYAVDTTRPMATPVFFSVSEEDALGGGIDDSSLKTRGLLEMYPHHHVHRSVGGVLVGFDEEGNIVEVNGAMAAPPTAAFDPIFPIHHTNIDRLWAAWSCMPGKGWGNLPDKEWFDERPWIFFDVDGREVNEPRKKYFNHRALGISFKYEDMSREPLQLPDYIMAEDSGINFIAAHNSRPSRMTRSQQLLALSAVPFTATGLQRAVVHVTEPAKMRLKTSAANFKARLQTSDVLVTSPAEKRIFVRLLNINLDSLQATGFDVHVTANPNSALTRSDNSFVGSIALFNQPAGHAGQPRARTTRTLPSAHDEPLSQTFDITKAVASIDNETLAGLTVVLVPYSLVSLLDREIVFRRTDFMKVEGIEFFMR